MARISESPVIITTTILGGQRDPSRPVGAGAFSGLFGINTSFFFHSKPEAEFGISSKDSSLQGLGFRV